MWGPLKTSHIKTRRCRRPLSEIVSNEQMEYLKMNGEVGYLEGITFGFFKHKFWRNIYRGHVIGVGFIIINAHIDYSGLFNVPASLWIGDVEGGQKRMVQNNKGGLVELATKYNPFCALVSTCASESRTKEHIGVLGKFGRGEGRDFSEEV